mmetsp:Transcript_20958/g.59865  ORF Transcript_20958/g.59865 Transcript_20958/m.59865 type:complete len:443 (+) Transcript_20958:10-1338(+)
MARVCFVVLVLLAGRGPGVHDLEGVEEVLVAQPAVAVEGRMVHEDVDLHLRQRSAMHADAAGGLEGGVQRPQCLPQPLARDTANVPVLLGDACLLQHLHRPQKARLVGPNRGANLLHQVRLQPMSGRSIHGLEGVDELQVVHHAVAGIVHGVHQLVDAVVRSALRHQRRRQHRGVLREKRLDGLCKLLALKEPVTVEVKVPENLEHAGGTSLRRATGVLHPQQPTEVRKHGAGPRRRLLLRRAGRCRRRAIAERQLTACNPLLSVDGEAMDDAGLVPKAHVEPGKELKHSDRAVARRRLRPGMRREGAQERRRLLFGDVVAQHPAESLQRVGVADLAIAATEETLELLQGAGLTAQRQQAAVEAPEELLGPPVAAGDAVGDDHTEAAQKATVVDVLGDGVEHTPRPPDRPPRKCVAENHGHPFFPISIRDEAAALLVAFFPI